MRLLAMVTEPARIARDRAVSRLLPRLGDWRLVPTEVLDPKPDGPETYLNAVSRRINDVRDPYMVRALTLAVRESQRVLAVVGASHVVMQERALAAAVRPARVTHRHEAEAPASP